MAQKHNLTIRYNFALLPEKYELQNDFPTIKKAQYILEVQNVFLELI
jgi:hypothetical protein